MVCSAFFIHLPLLFCKRCYRYSLIMLDQRLLIKCNSHGTSVCSICGHQLSRLIRHFQHLDLVKTENLNLLNGTDQDISLTLRLSILIDISFALLPCDYVHKDDIYVIS